MRAYEKEDFVKEVKTSESGELLELIFKDGRVLRGVRARLVNALRGYDSVDNALPREEATKVVYGIDSEVYYERFKSLIPDTNKLITPFYKRRISIVPLSKVEKTKGARGGLYIERVSINSGEVFPSRLEALSFLSEDDPDFEEILNRLGPSKRGRRLSWWQGIWSLNKHLRMLAERSTPSGGKIPQTSENEKNIWETLKNSVGESDDYEAQRRLMARLKYVESKQRALRFNKEKSTQVEVEDKTLSPTEKALLAFWINERAPMFAEVFDINVISTISEIGKLAKSEELDLSSLSDSDRKNIILKKVIDIIRGSTFNDVYNNESEAAKKLLENLWIIDEEAVGLELALGDRWEGKAAMIFDDTDLSEPPENPRI